MPQYRGYKIQVNVMGGEKRVEISPIYPDLPILPSSSYQPQRCNEEEAVVTAKRLIDELLARL
jgi:hypothetical protein